ncbi:MAG: lytic transglycosylase protein [Flaviaesturariibacter sp.]|nr:lytic transglycosylase protein [Flaviaesturariibacter sp.]
MLKTNFKGASSIQSFALVLTLLLFTYVQHESVKAQTVVKGQAIMGFISDTVTPLIDPKAILAEANAPKISLSVKSQRTVDNYLAVNGEALNSIAKRSPSYFKTIDAVFSKHGVPLQLKYLAVVESNLKTVAVSRCGAVGIWQLMPETARSYGLKVGRHSDERKHVYKSTLAAAKYISGLYKEFGDWLLVIAAYNGGSGTVHAAIRKSGSKNFYALQRYLPAETKAHVQHYIATHYYFEGQGSITTLTKKEATTHLQRVSDYLSLRICEIEKLRPDASAPSAIAIAEK